MDISDKSGCSEDEGSIDILLDEDDDIDDDIVLHKSESYLKAPLHDIDKLTTKLKQRSGSLRGGRTRGRRHQHNYEKHWGNASTPVISRKDIMGGEKNATKVGMTRSAHSRQGRSSKDPQAAREKIVKRKLARKDRIKDVKNSLSHFLHANEESNESEYEEAEDDSLISDEDEAYRLEMQRASEHDNQKAPGGDNDNGKRDEEHSDDEKSVKSTRSHSRRRRRHPRRTHSEEGLNTSSSHSRKRPPRRRNKQVEADDDATVGSRRSRRSRRTFRETEDGSNGAHRRRGRGDVKSVDSGLSRRRRDSGKQQDHVDDKHTAGWV